MKQDITMLPVLAANLEQLALLRMVVEPLNGAAYEYQIAGSGSLGSHVRHILDHYHALCLAMESEEGFLDYEQRERGRASELQPQAAMEEIDLVRARLDIMWQRIHQLRDDDLTLIEDNRAVAKTSVSRELSFLSSHTVHHLAIIRLLVQKLGEAPDPRLGVHPSTLRARDKSCAR